MYVLLLWLSFWNSNYFDRESWQMEDLSQDIVSWQVSTRRKRISGRSENDHKHPTQKSGSPSRMLLRWPSKDTMKNRSLDLIIYVILLYFISTVTLVSMLSIICKISTFVEIVDLVYTVYHVQCVMSNSKNWIVLRK